MPKVVKLLNSKLSTKLKRENSKYDYKERCLTKYFPFSIFYLL
jgi:hypothetical protein